MKYMILKCILKYIANNVQPPQTFAAPETELPFKFVLFEYFSWVCYSWWEDNKTYFLSSVLFVHKNMESSTLKTF